MSMTYEAFVKINTEKKEKAKVYGSVYRILEYDKANEMVRVLEVNTESEKSGTLVSLLDSVVKGNIHITNPSMIVKSKLFSNNVEKVQGPVVVKLCIKDEYAPQTEYLVVKTPDNKSKSAIEFKIHEIAETQGMSRTNAEVTKWAKKLLQMYGYTVDFFIDYMNKVLGWEVDYADNTEHYDCSVSV